MARTREHKHDWKFAGVNRRLSAFPGMVAERVYACARPGCGATSIRGGLKPDPSWRPAERGRPRDVLAFIESRLG